MKNEHRDQVIFYLRIVGLSYRRIARLVGLHYSNCYRRYARLTEDDKIRLSKSLKDRETRGRRDD